MYLGFNRYEVEGDGYQPIGNILDTHDNQKIHPDFFITWKHFFNTLFMASNAKVNPPDEEHLTRYVLGDPTEAALITLAQKAGIDTEKM